MRKFINISLSATCNLQCSYCGGADFPMDSALAISQIKTITNNYDPDKTCFRVECKGEITLYPQLIQFLEEYSNQYKIELLSNGARLPAQKDTSNLHWVISLDGHTERMNHCRNLMQDKVDKMLEFILNNNAEIQMVYSDQSIDEINEFIRFLSARNYQGFLHIFPVMYRGGKIQKVFDYTALEYKSFIPTIDYFERWDYIQQNVKRNMVCDRLTNGYAYCVLGDKIYMVKCDCSFGAIRFVHEFGEEMTHENFPCSKCITHYEYNNSRPFILD